MHLLPSIKGDPSLTTSYSECAQHLCCLLLLLLLTVIQMRSVTRRPAAGHFQLLVGKQNVLLPDLP